MTTLLRFSKCSRTFSQSVKSSAILLDCDSTHVFFFASGCGMSGDSRPAILGIVQFAIRDSVPLSHDIQRLGGWK